MKNQGGISGENPRCSASRVPTDLRQPRRERRAVKPHRSFDPTAVAQLECDAWVAYYRRDWLAFVRSAVTLSRRVLGLSWPATVYCSWLVLRATQMWAPSRDNRAERAQRTMERFYRMVRRRYGESWDPATAAALELRWWRIHRENQHSAGDGRDQALAGALARLYSHIYGVPYEAVLGAAEHRADAMRQSDQWIREGRRLDSPRIEEERAELTRSYEELLTAVGRTAPVWVFGRRPDASDPMHYRRWRPVFDRSSTVI
jgi:hypothetical protein